MQSVLNNIQTWYSAQCDGDWEHSFGIEINTLDNPGWSVRISLAGTLLQEKDFASIDRKESDQSWISCKVEEKSFVGVGDSTRLEEILGIFVDWAKTESNWLAIQEETESERQTRQDREFWLLLAEEAGEEKCRKLDCERPKLKNSVFCRKHHFEMIKKRPAPEDE